MNVPSSWLDVLVRTDMPALPALALQQSALRAEWALVVAWLVAVMVGWCLRRVGVQQPLTAVRAVSLLAALGTLFLPEAASPSYWLGLAFQWPSLMTAVLCSLGLWRALQQQDAVAQPDRNARLHWLWAAWVCSAWGWLLLLDTFALLPVHLYAWGFSPLALAVLVALALALCLWAQADARSASTGIGTCLLWVLVVHVLTRLPTGNVWDALMDPWLWLFAQAWLVQRLWRRMSLRARG